MSTRKTKQNDKKKQEEEKSNRKNKHLNSLITSR